MASLDTQPRSGRCQRRTPRIDMTPMVDLGFLLLTFFVLTTHLTTDQTMPIALPEKDGGIEPIGESKLIHLVLLAEDRAVVYQTEQTAIPPQARWLQGHMGSQVFRKQLLAYRTEVERRIGVGQSIVLIKNLPTSRYGNLVDALDDMLILNQRKYAVVEPSADDLTAFAPTAGPR